MLFVLYQSSCEHVCVCTQQGHHVTDKEMALFAKDIGVLPNLYFWNSKALQHDGSQDAPALNVY